MGRLCNAGGTRGAGRCGETRLQAIEEVSAVIAVEAKIGVSRVPSIHWGSIDRRRHPVFAKTGDERVALPSDPITLGAGVLATDESGGGAHADAQRHRYGAGTQAVLLSATMNQGFMRSCRVCRTNSAPIPWGP